MTGRAGLHVVLAASVALVAAPLPSMASSPPAADARAPGRQQQDAACASRPAAAAAAAAAPRSEEGRDLEDPKAAPAAKRRRASDPDDMVAEPSDGEKLLAFINSSRPAADMPTCATTSRCCSPRLLLAGCMLAASMRR